MKIFIAIPERPNKKLESLVIRASSQEDALQKVDQWMWKHQPTLSYYQQARWHRPSYYFSVYEMQDEAIVIGAVTKKEVREKNERETYQRRSDILFTG